MHQTQSSKKAMNYHKQTARKQRQEIIAKRRKQMLKKQTQFPLTNDCLQTYWDIPASKLYLYRDQIFQTLDDVDGQQLSEEQTHELCQDLLYLINNDTEFVIPYTMKFRKDDSPLTATLIAFVYDLIDPNEGNYWLQYMNDENRSTIYLNIQCSQQEYPDKWINDAEFLQMMVNDWGVIEQAEEAISWLLGGIDSEASDFLESVFNKLFTMNKQKQVKLTPTFFVILLRLMIHNRQNQRTFSYLSILLNESIQKLYQEDKNMLFDENFLSLVDAILFQTKQNYKIIFNHGIFQKLLEMLKNNYQKKFIDQNSSKWLKLHVSQKNFEQLQQRFLSRIIEVCFNHLRINRLFKNNISINQKLIDSFEPSNCSELKQKYIKLVQFNNVYLAKDNRSNKTNHKTYQISSQLCHEKDNSSVLFQI